MRARPRGWHRLAGGLLLGGLAGCAVAPPPAPPPPVSPAVEAPELVRQWAAEWESFVGLRAAVELTIRRRERNDRVAAVLLASPTSLRVEVATPFGLPAVVAVARPDEIVVFRVLERRAQVGRPTPEAVTRWLGVPVTPDMLVRLLVGQVPLPGAPGAVRPAAGPASQLDYERDGVPYRVWVGPEGRPARLLVGAEGPDRLTVSFGRAGGGGLESLRIEAPRRDAELVLRYLSAELAAPPPEVFAVTLPSDVRVQPLN